MKKFLVLLCAMFLVFSMTDVASALPKYVYDGGLGNWHDADKTNPFGDPDSFLCWAAAASNALAWAGWPGLEADGITLISTADEIFDYFVNNWPNNTGNVMYGYDWWFDNIDNDPDDNPTGDAGFYASNSLIPGVYGGYWGNNPPTESAISGYIDDDRAIEIQVELIGFNHSLTVWGMDETTNELYITDSDDGVEALQTFNYYTSGGSLYLQNYTNLYTTAQNVRISQAVRLNRNDDGLAPQLIGGDKVIPEPGTILLLGIGLLGLISVLRKRRSV